MTQPALLSLDAAAQRLGISETVLLRLSQYFRVPRAAYDDTPGALSFRGDLLFAPADLGFFAGIRSQILNGRSLEAIRADLSPDDYPAAGGESPPAPPQADALLNEEAVPRSFLSWIAGTLGRSPGASRTTKKYGWHASEAYLAPTEPEAPLVEDATNAFGDTPIPDTPPASIAETPLTEPPPALPLAEASTPVPLRRALRAGLADESSLQKPSRETSRTAGSSWFTRIHQMAGRPSRVPATEPWEPPDTPMADEPVTEEAPAQTLPSVVRVRTAAMPRPAKVQAAAGPAVDWGRLSVPLGVQAAPPLSESLKLAARVLREQALTPKA